ncbi:MAG TPA: adenylate/guanylate cyclase domain-containing protein [Alphaproteobacteria bacterium]|nr:adenylate/guanylate cyclase domain-containing protein [Alphaproteobacteria bacterium]
MTRAATTASNPSETNRRRISIALVLASATAALVACAILAVLVVLFLAARTTTNELLNNVANLIIRDIEKGIDTHLAPAVSQVSFLADRIAGGAYAGVDDPALAELLTGALAAAPQIQGVVLTQRDLRQVVVVRQDSGQLQILRGLPADLEHASRALGEIEGVNGPIWGEPTFRLGRTFFNVRQAVRRHGEFLGMLASVISVQELSLLLTESGAQYRGTAFILHGAGRVLAHPNLVSAHPAQSATSPSVPVTQLGDPVLPMLASRRAVAGFEGLAGRGIEVSRIDVQDSAYYVIMRWRRDFGDAALGVGVWLGADEEIAARQRLTLAAILGLAVLAFATVAAIWLGRALSRPVERVAEASRKLTRFELAGLDPLPASRLKEIDDQATAFNSMLGGLAQFERYVPKRLVRRLIELGVAGAVRSEERLVTVMFTDIVGFTSISERLSPAEIADLLNHHFSLVAGCVESESGTIDKFIGDAVMAFWGAPDVQPDHAIRACHAATCIARMLANMPRPPAGDGPGVRIRVGIHSGKVLVGNIGSETRTNYTVIGDAVNASQRIEALAKEFDRGDSVTILISGDTAALLDGSFKLEPLGDVELRGRRAATTLYRLIA